LAAALAASCALAQYDTGFEVADGINASAGGTVLTGQDSYYLPTGVTSVDFLAYTYAGNTLGIAANPQGGQQFVGVIGPGGGTIYGRAQRDINWGATTATVSYDACCIYQGNPPASNNLGSFSVQPYPGSASYIHLFSFADINNPTSWRAFYLAYTAAGVVHTQPGMSPGALWENIPMNRWMHFETDISFTENRITQVRIRDLTTNQTATFDPLDWYLEGGQAGGRPLPTGFRMFSGGSLVGNATCFDNMNMTLGGTGYQLSVSGACPGTVTVSWTGAGQGQQGLVIGNQPGQTIIPQNQPCAGTVLGIQGQVALVDPPGIHSTQGGAGSFSGPCPGAASGKYLQLVRGGTCDTSNVVQLP
jgi:hypothetical protein